MHAADAGTVQVNGWQLVFTAGDRGNKIEMSRAGDTFFFWDNREITPQAGCWRPVPTEPKLAQCSAAGVGQIVVWANGGDDEVNTLTLNMNTPLFLSGGTGNDTLRANDGDDFLYGEEGADFVDGGAGRNNVNRGPDVDTCWNGPVFVNCP